MDLNALSKKEYAGRWIAIGANPKGRPFVAYGIQGRSPSSQARRFHAITNGSSRRIEIERIPVEGDQGNIDLIEYSPMRQVQGGIVVSNGNQTDPLEVATSSALRNWTRVHSRSPYDLLGEVMLNSSNPLANYEPDSLHTPRISGIRIGDQAALHLVQRDSSGRKRPQRWGFQIEPGRAKFISTYDGNSESPNSFVGGPKDCIINLIEAQDIMAYAHNAMSETGPNGENYAVSTAIHMDRKGFHVLNRF